MTPAAAARHKGPSRADYDVIISVREDVVHDAHEMSQAISRCERRSGDPFGSGLDEFNACIRTRLSVEEELSRLEPVFLTGVLRHLRPGRCLSLVGALEAVISDLSEAAANWTADIENGGASRAQLERADARTTLDVVRSADRLSHRPWRQACRPRRALA